MRPLSLADAKAAFADPDVEARREAVSRLDLPEEGEPGEQELAFLVEAMGDESWRVRKEAAAQAARFADRGVAARVLAVALGEPDNVGRRNAVVEALVALGGDAVPPLVEAVKGKPEHRKMIADTLGLIGHAAAVAPLTGLLGDGDPNVRVAAAEALGRIGGDEAQAALRRMLASRSGGQGEGTEVIVHLAALDGLNRSGAHLPAAELAPLYQEPGLRRAAIEALGRSGDAAALPLLSSALGDGARSVREAAVCAIASLHHDAPDSERDKIRTQLSLDGDRLPAVIQALLEGTLGVQRAAAAVLGLSRRAQAVRPLTVALGDPELRDAAMAALGSIGSVGIEALVELAPDLEGRLRAEVYTLLPVFGAEARSPRVLGLLVEALSDEDLDAAAGAAEALGTLGGREELAPLFRALERPPEVAHEAALALGQLGKRHYDQVRILVSSRGLAGPDAPEICRVLGLCGHPEDAPLLRSALGGESAAVRRAAADALGGLTLPAASTEIEEALVFALADESPDVRAAAARALGQHAPAATLPQTVEVLARVAQDPEIAVRGAAARALAQVAAKAQGRERARAHAELRRLVDTVLEAKAALGTELASAVPAIEGLGGLADPADDDRLIRALEAAEPELVKAAARALGSRRDAVSAEEARGALERALTDRRWEVRQAAALALGEHGPIAHPLLYARRTVERDGLVLEAIDEALQRSLANANDRGEPPAR
jgi:HEAT repeat protein